MYFTINNFFFRYFLEIEEIKNQLDGYAGLVGLSEKHFFPEFSEILGCVFARKKKNLPDFPDSVFLFSKYFVLNFLRYFSL